MTSLATEPGVWEMIPVAAWGAIGLVGAAIFTAMGAVFGTWITNRRNAKVDSGQLALEYATALRGDVNELKDRVTSLESERNAYRSHAHVLHEWGGYVATAERPRPEWPVNLPR